ncbi:MAG: sigma-54-dependent transcriptional regulator [Sandaracinaceae bacterium]
MSAAHVLVVDDERDLLELLSLRLEHHGYAVTTEASARGALELLAREVFDVVILDLRLEDGDGMDVLARIRETDPDLPVVMLTAHGSIEAAVEAMRRGAYGFLTKPFHDHELLQRLENALEGSQLRRELASFRRMLGGSSPGARLIGGSDAIARVRELLARIAPSDATALITGESGTGKELAARIIHELSPRAESAFVAINCAALPAELLESELFGHVKGAFTGAQQAKDGLFRAAEGGTIFLDEIGDAPLPVQAKLLRVLQERRFMPVGSVTELECDVRVLAATNRDLARAVADGTFREDLYYRLHVVPVRLPPLRERPEDIAPLADLFLREAAQQQGAGRIRLCPDALTALRQHSWPGNVRELANVMTGAALLAEGEVLRWSDVAAVLPAPPPGPAREIRETPLDASPATGLPRELVASPDGSLLTMREAREAFDRAYLEEALARSQGNVSKAARMAERHRTDFHDLLRRHGIDAARFRQIKSAD